jgi:hypothetical protein
MISGKLRQELDSVTITHGCIPPDTLSHNPGDVKPNKGVEP